MKFEDIKSGQKITVDTILGTEEMTCFYKDDELADFVSDGSSFVLKNDDEYDETVKGFNVQFLEGSDEVGEQVGAMFDALRKVEDSGGDLYQGLQDFLNELDHGNKQINS